MQPEELRQIDNEHLWHPFTQMRGHRAENVPLIESGDGFCLIDVEGRRYLDGVSSLWCNVHGHRVPELDQAVRDQLDRIAHSTLLGLGSVPSIELAGELVKRAPEGLTKVFYSDSGSTAVEIALKMAFQYHNQKPNPDAQSRDLFACMQHAYHGDTIGSVSVGGISIFHEIFGHCAMLTNPAFANFTQKYGELGLKASPKERAYLARLYWFTVEFGLMNTKDGLRIYGGGILSSPKETLYALSDAPMRAPFEAVDALRTPYRIDIVQPIYYVLDQLETLQQLTEIDLMARVREAMAAGLYEPLFPPKEAA